MGEDPGKNRRVGIGPTIEIAALGQAGSVPHEFRVWPAGWVEFLDGDRVLLDDQAMAEVVARQKETGYDLVIDYHHQSTPEIQPDNPYLRPDRQAPAAGWCRLEAREDGLWAVDVRWTAQAAEAIGSRAYRYISPAFWFNKETRRLVEIEALSLTNTPATRFAEPLVAQHRKGGDQVEKLKEFLVKLAQAFGLKEELTEEAALKLARAAAQTREATAKVAQALGLEPDKAQPEEVATRAAELAQAAEDDKGQGATAFRAEAAQALGLPPKATESEVLGALKAKAAGSEDAAKMAERLAALEAERAEDKAAALVQAAQEAGKIHPVQAEWLKDLAVKDYAQAQAYVEAAPQIVPTGGPQTAAVRLKSGQEGLSPEAVKVAQLLGLDPKKVAEQAAKEG